jgi:hypothetical protein
MSKKPDLFERGEAARTERFAETDRHYEQKMNRPGTGVIRRGNEALYERTGSDRYPAKGVKRD